jgi:two-component system, OmpR family, response regulator
MTPPAEDDDLDFTGAGPAPAPPSAQAVAKARKEAEVGSPQLRSSGFYVSIARHAATRIPPRNGTKYVVLVVEDDRDLGQMLIDIFVIAGFEVRWAANRAEINAEMKRGNEVDLVLMDIVLPDADGLLILKRLRTHPVLVKLPVIMMTGKGTAGDVAAGLAAGADGYVTKPFQMSGLVKAANQVLGNV